ncbi:hypothetical protein [Dehalobacter sp.]|uniref:hypothetical protein n=1 Tax=Dehalobacter sp. TaxID=1962289 RepID=UPI00258338F2|nr:hypothetical protein [Dehalobacter sp.]MDJ0306731.1 hypothetical protein [Dehalobacter sp.]
MVWIFLRLLLLLYRHPDFPQEHLRNVAGGGSQTGNGVQRIEVQNTLEVLKTKMFCSIIAAPD